MLNCHWYGSINMNIALSGRFSRDVFDVAFAILESTRQCIEESLITEINAEIEVLAVFPVIISDFIEYSGRDYRKYSRADNAELVVVHISARHWTSSSLNEKVSILVGLIRKSVRDTDHCKLTISLKNQILSELSEIERCSQVRIRKILQDT